MRAGARQAGRQRERGKQHKGEAGKRERQQQEKKELPGGRFALAQPRAVADDKMIRQTDASEERERELRHAKHTQRE